MDEFRDSCTGKKSGKNEFGIDYIPECYRQRPPELDRSRLLSSDEREEKREKARDKIAELKAALNSQVTE